MGFRHPSARSAAAIAMAAALLASGGLREARAANPSMTAIISGLVNMTGGSR